MPLLFFSACPPVPCERPNGAAGAPFTVVKPFAESKRDDATHRELESQTDRENLAREGMEKQIIS